MRFVLEVEDYSVSGSHFLKKDELRFYRTLDNWKDKIEHSIDDKELLTIDFAQVADFARFLDETGGTCNQEATNKPIVADIYYSIILP